MSGRPISGACRRLTRSFRALACGRDGTTAVEFAFVGPVLLVLIFGIFEVGRGLWMQNALNLSVEQAARCASIDKNDCGTTQQVTSYAATVAGAGFTAADFTASLGVACTKGSAVTGNLVTASIPIALHIPGLATTYNVTAQSCYPL